MVRKKDDYEYKGKGNKKVVIYRKIRSNKQVESSGGVWVGGLIV